jgi:hypothetical protein
MRGLNQVLLRASLGVLILTPCAYGRSVRADYTAMLRSESNTRTHFTGNRLWFSGRSVFLHTEPRAIRGSVHIVPELLSHNGHGTGVSNWGNGSNPGSGGNWGNGSNPGPGGNPGSGGNWSNGSNPGPSGNLNNGPNPGPGGNWGNGSNPGPGGNTVQGGYTSVPEGGTTASYLVPAGFVAFGGIFLAGFRRQGTTF